MKKIEIKQQSSSILPVFSLMKNLLYDKLPFTLNNFILNEESKEYEACSFTIENRIVFSRTAKITPKKIGQFVTIWERNEKGITQPYSENSEFDFIIINVKKENLLGQFVFPKDELLQQGIISSLHKNGKRGIRVYPSWDKAINKQAIKTQNWQLNYFFMIGIDLPLDLEK